MVLRVALRGWWHIPRTLNERPVRCNVEARFVIMTCVSVTSLSIFQRIMTLSQKLRGILL